MRYELNDPNFLSIFVDFVTGEYNLKITSTYFVKFLSFFYFFTNFLQSYLNHIIVMFSISRKDFSLTRKINFLDSLIVHITIVFSAILLFLLTRNCLNSTLHSSNQMAQRIKLDRYANRMLSNDPSPS